MKKLAFIAAVLASGLASVGAQAACFGSGATYTCNDASGNSYAVQHFGNQTNVQGRNAATGSTWNETSNTFGNTTYQRGTASNGNSWNQTIQTSPLGTTYSGSDSRGNAFHRTCNQFGCH